MTFRDHPSDEQLLDPDGVVSAHLTGCGECRQRRHEQQQVARMIAGLPTHAAPAHWQEKVLQRVARRRRGPGRTPIIVVSGVALALAAGVALGVAIRPRPAPRPPLAVVDLGLAPSRGVEVRFTAPIADGYRPYDAVRSASRARGGSESIQLALLAQLERAGESRALAAAEALRGNVEGARHALSRAPDDVRAHSDAAALALLDGNLEQALSLAARAAALGVIQARWNEALALRQLGLPLTAARRFEEVARAAEPGWAKEATRTAAALRAAHEAQEASWREVQRVTRALVEGEPNVIVGDELLRRHAEALRAALYRAVRSTGSPARLRELARLLAAIDRVHGDASLVRYVTRVGHLATAERARLGDRYARLVEHYDAAVARRLLATARDGGQDDLLLGTLLLAAGNETLTPAARDELRALADRSGDVYLRLVAAERLAFNLLYKARRSADALRETSAALDACAARDSFLSVCAKLEALAAAAASSVGQSEASRAHLARAQAFAAATYDADAQRTVLYVAAEETLARTSDEVDVIALADAYFEEMLARTDRCIADIYRHDHMGLALLRLNRREEAARHAAASAELLRGRCQQDEYNYNTITLFSYVLQGGGDARAVDELRGVIAAQRATALSDGARALLDHAEGRLEIERAPEVGQRLLESAIARGRRSDDDIGREAAKRAESLLFTAAVRRGDAAEGLRIAGGLWGLRATPRCTAAVGGEEITAVAVVGADGVPRAAALPVPAGAAVLPAGARIPAALTGALRDCDEVAVLALGDYYGTPRILPVEIAWYYRSRHGSGGRPLPGNHLVVTDVAPPAELRLAPLPGDVDAEGAVVLRGAGATPGAVLAQLPAAAFVEVHAHGLFDLLEPSAASLALSPGADGEYRLDARAIAGARLERRPAVFLAACGAGRVSNRLEHWGLAEAFVSAGASAVVAAPTEIPNADAGALFGALRRRVVGGDSAAQAVRNERMARVNDPSWVMDLVVFQ